MAEATTTRPAASADGHFHRWRIDEPSGPVSQGVCKECGATRTFKNWLSDGDFITNEEHRVAAAA
ncbi:MAG: hypothetical protein LC118_16890 [Dehalococcoidia bacterium]|nr:hypothetical protein [Dehalococcoidia bacterium]